MEKSVKILITGKLHDVALQLLKNQPPELAVTEPLEIVYLPDAPRDVILKEIENTNVLISRSETDVDAPLLRAAKKLSVVARAAVGYGNIDCDMATELGILVVNTPGKNTNSAAELTLGLLLSLLRKIPAAHQSTSAGGWNRHHFTGIELGGKTIGIVGLGNVGHRVAKFAKGFDMRVICYDPYISDEVFRKNQAERKNTLEELLADCDILSVHVPLNKETKSMIREVELKKMRKGSFVLNAARGGIINEKDLLKTLHEGYIAGAGIDTFENEPNPLKELISHPNVIVSPHIGASTLEAQYRIGETIAIQVLKSLRGEIVDYPVNLPHVSILGSGDLRQFSVLTEKTSLVAAQIFDFHPAILKLTVNANVNKEDLQILKLSCLKGFLSHVSDEFVSYVNAERLLAKRGIQFEIELKNTLTSKNELLIEVFGTGTNEKISVGSVLYDGKFARLCSINDFIFEIEPEGDLIVMQNHDRPGVIGDVGTYLAKNKVNIAQFELSRNRRGGMAMSLIRVDGELETKVIDDFRKLPNLISAKLVSGL
ncbi:phosphoglycerate dehydrogenase [Silvanigrella aquatica]|uniref:D-3-phosphoglycerate dehydrogenase n=1 Tax=Silvanigrella aquatica TaxID=1915309 RepID=A0A1L4CZW0_9BACT|nr:phosphoglycerate dehydrogenase [Silvanigrella aquatica]APJ03467.1 phosphoglycerate dehydrogenase [Silvanigrella aquatica]